MRVNYLPFMGGWVVDSAAKIIMDQLFISIEHKLVLRGTPTNNRAMLDRTHRHNICHHILTCNGRGISPQTFIIPKRIPQLEPRVNAIKECHNTLVYYLVYLYNKGLY